MEILPLNEQQSYLQQPCYVHHQNAIFANSIHRGDIWVGHFSVFHKWTERYGVSRCIRPEVNHSGQELSAVWCFASADPRHQTVNVNVTECQSNSTEAVRISLQHVSERLKQCSRFLTTMTKESHSTYFPPAFKSRDYSRPVFVQKQQPSVSSVNSQRVSIQLAQLQQSWPLWKSR